MLRKKTFKLIFTALLCLALTPAFSVSAAERLQDTGEKVVVVIDPGHGGKNKGTIENNHEEKLMTMITAQAMYDELSLYEGVEVYLTRTGDFDETKELSLKERAEFAGEKDADFLFSIHYNASENHELFGSEVWVSAFAPFNAYGYQFGNVFLTDMREMGLFIRGVKTRLGDKGTDYYGIIREAAALEVPAVIIEHCHVDEERDEIYCATDEQLQEFGRADATAVAKYFGLKSSALGVDYSDLQLAEAKESITQPITLRDETKPDVCQIEFTEADYENGWLKLNVSAADYDSMLLYYDYSLDGGLTYSRREIWPDADALAGTYTDSFTLNLKIPGGTAPKVIVRAYNLFDLYTESNEYISPQAFTLQETPVPAEQDMGSGESELASEMIEQQIAKASSDKAEADKEISLLTFLEICLAVVVFLFLLLLVSQFISYRKKKKHRLQRRKEAGERRNQPR